MAQAKKAPKRPAGEPPVSFEELTAGAADFSTNTLLGAPAAAGAAPAATEPASSAPAPAAETAPAPDGVGEQEGEKTGPAPEQPAAPVEETPAPAPVEVVTAPASPEPAANPPAPTDRVGETGPEDEVADEAPAAGAGDAAAPAAAALDLAALFATSPGKKGTVVRVTEDNQRFFAELGFVLGERATAPDIIHNILTQFRLTHEPELRKLMRKKLAGKR